MEAASRNPGLTPSGDYPCDAVPFQVSFRTKHLLYILFCAERAEHPHDAAPFQVSVRTKNTYLCRAPKEPYVSAKELYISAREP